MDEETRSEISNLIWKLRDTARQRNSRALTAASFGQAGYLRGRTVQAELDAQELATILNNALIRAGLPPVELEPAGPTEPAT